MWKPNVQPLRKKTKPNSELNLECHYVTVTVKKKTKQPKTSPN